jgi:hypothetical protein
MLVALAVLTLVALGPLGRALGSRTQARTAADAAALAGAVEGEEAARRLADANGADLVGFERRDGDVVVEVRVGGVEAWSSARATRLAPPVAGVGRHDLAAGTGAGRPDLAGTAAAAGDGAGRAPGGGDRAGLAPAMLAALDRADQLLGEVVPVASGLRTRAEQQALWDRRHVNPYPVARPGTSDHESGLAIDVPRRFVPRLLSVAAGAGLCQPLPESDPVHFVVCGT